MCDNFFGESAIKSTPDLALLLLNRTQILFFPHSTTIIAPWQLFRQTHYVFFARLSSRAADYFSFDETSCNTREHARLRHP